MSSLKLSRATGAIAEPALLETLRQAAAALLRKASALLGRLSRRLAQRPARITHPCAQLEFYAEAGAPEGALYLNGEFVGWVRGVQRL